MENTNIYANVDVKVKARAEEIIEQQGISVSDAISEFYNKIIEEKQIPFIFENENSKSSHHKIMEKLESKKGLSLLVEERIEQAFNN